MRYLHRNEPQTYPSPACPCCGHPDENASHIILCPDQGRTNLYNDSVTDLVRAMDEERENTPHNCASRQEISSSPRDPVYAPDLDLMWRQTGRKSNRIPARGHARSAGLDKLCRLPYTQEVRRNYIVSRPSNQQRSRESSAK